MGRRMVTELKITLPDEIYERMMRLAERTHQDVEVIIAMMLGLSMPSLLEMDLRPINTLSDDEVLALAKSRMDDVQSQRMSVLQHRQQAGEMSNREQQELNILMEIYEAGQSRKADALVEAVRRNLRERLDA